MDPTVFGYLNEVFIPSPAKGWKNSKHSKKSRNFIWYTQRTAPEPDVEPTPQSFHHERGEGVALHPLLRILSVAGAHAVGVVTEAVVVSTATSVWERQTTLVFLAVEELTDILTAEPRVEEESAELGNSQTLNTIRKALENGGTTQE